MKLKHITPLFALTACQVNNSEAIAPVEKAIQSRLIETGAEDLILLQEVIVEAPVQSVWNAYTTEEGWKAWASPAVEIDLRAGGLIRTHYGKDAHVGDPGTNVLHIINYIPERLLTLQADVEERWPEVMKLDAENLMNVILFESLGENRTKIMSYGVGYKNTEAYNELMNFFIPANEGLFKVLKDQLEK
ncbi:MAG: SRPBCC domain-containing protein [Planctomycetes bacterium]|nr:SRPBCC domain-containing protein [Planctomycetota bacterium]